MCFVAVTTVLVSSLGQATAAAAAAAAQLQLHAQQQSAGYERNEPGHLDAEVVLITQRLGEGEARGSGISSEQ